MLRSLKDQSGSWVIKIVLGLIVLSFAFFGVGDMIRTYSSSKTIASVCSTKIPIQEFLYNLKKDLMRNSSKNEDARAKNAIASNVLNQIITKKAIESFIKDNNISIPKNMLLDYAKNLPFLKNNDVFDPNILKRLLDNMGMSEGEFLSEIERDILLDQLNTIWTSNDSIPEGYLNIVMDFLSKYKAYTIVHVETKENLTFSSNDLQKFFLEHSEDYMLDEKRSFEIAYFKTTSESNKALRDKIDDMIAAGDNFDKITKANPDVKVLKSELITKQDKLFNDEKTITDEIKKDIVINFWDKKEGTLEIIESNDGFIVVHLSKAKEKMLPELKDVEKKVTEDLKEKKKQEASFESAKNIVKEIKTNAELIKFAESKGFKIIATEKASLIDLKNAPTLKLAYNFDRIMDLSLNESEIFIVDNKVFIAICSSESSDEVKTANKKDNNIKENIKKMVTSDFSQIGQNSLKKDVFIDYDLLKKVTSDF